MHGQSLFNKHGEFNLDAHVTRGLNVLPPLFFSISFERAVGSSGPAPVNPGPVPPVPPVAFVLTSAAKPSAAKANTSTIKNESFILTLRFFLVH